MCFVLQVLSVLCTFTLTNVRKIMLTRMLISSLTHAPTIILALTATITRTLTLLLTHLRTLHHSLRIRIAIIQIRIRSLNLLRTLSCPWLLKLRLRCILAFRYDILAPLLPCVFSCESVLGPFRRTHTHHHRHPPRPTGKTNTADETGNTKTANTIQDQ